MKKNQNYFISILLLLAFFTPGCAVFRDPNNFIPVNPWPPKKFTGANIELDLKVQIIENGSEKPAGSKAAKWGKEIKKAFREAGFNLQKNNKETIKTEVTIISESEYSRPMTILSPLTLYIIPFFEKNKIAININFYDQNGRVLGSVETSENINRINALYLLPIAIFNPPFSIYPEIIYDLTRANINKANKILIFEKL